MSLAERWSLQSPELFLQQLLRANATDHIEQEHMVLL